MTIKYEENRAEGRKWGEKGRGRREEDRGNRGPAAEFIKLILNEIFLRLKGKYEIGKENREGGGRRGDNGGRRGVGERRAKRIGEITHLIQIFRKINKEKRGSADEGARGRGRRTIGREEGLMET